jgi:hypothetical protein
VKSIIKALSGPRPRSPDGSTRASPASEQLEMSFSEQFSDELENQRSAFKTSLEKRGYEDGTPSLPIGETENEINALGDVTQFQDALDKNHNREKISSKPLVHSPEHDSSVRRQPVGRGLGAKFESEWSDP